MMLVKYGVAVDVYLPAITRGSQDFKLTPTLATNDCLVYKDGGAGATITAIPTNSPAGSAQIKVALTADEVSAKIVTVQLRDVDVTKEWEDQEIILQTYGHASASIPFDFSQITPAVNTVSVGATTQTARDLGAQLDAAITTRAAAASALSSVDYTVARAAKLDNLDTTISSRAAAANALSSVDWTTARAAKLDNLDAAISTRASLAAQTAQTNALTTIDTAVDTIQEKTDKLNFDEAGLHVLSEVFSISTDALSSIDDALMAGGNLPVDIKAINSNTAKAETLEKALNLGMELMDVNVMRISGDEGKANTLYNALISPDKVKADVKAIDSDDVKAHALRAALQGDGESGTIKADVYAIQTDALSSIDSALMAGGNLPADVQAIGVNVLSSIDAALASGANLPSDVKALDGDATAATNARDNFITGTGYNGQPNFNDGFVYLDFDSGISGFSFPTGTAKYPVDNSGDASAIASANKLSRIKVKVGTSERTIAHSDFAYRHIVGADSPLAGGLALEANEGATYENLRVKGTEDSRTAMFLRCVIYGGLYPRNCRIQQSVVLSGITIQPDTSSTAESIEDTAFNDATLNMGAVTSTIVSLQKCKGILTIANVTTANKKVRLNGFEGKIVIDASCTYPSAIVIRGGSGELVNGTGVDVDGFYPLSEVPVGDVSVGSIGIDALQSIDAALSLTHGPGSWDALASGSVTVMAIETSALQSIDAAITKLKFPGGVVHVRYNSGYSGIDYPNGEADRPVNNISDASTIASTNKISKIVIYTSYAAMPIGDAQANQMMIEGVSSIYGLSCVSMTDTRYGVTYKHLGLKKTDTSNERYPTILDCVIKSDFVVDNAIIRNSSLAASFTLKMESPAQLYNVTFEDSIIDLPTYGGVTWTLDKCSGILTVKNVKRADDVLNIFGFKGKITIDSTCTKGTINIYGGVDVLVDGHTGSCVVNELSEVSDVNVTSISTDVLTSIDNALSLTHGPGSWDALASGPVTVMAIQADALTSIDTVLAPRFTNIENALTTIDTEIGDIATEVHSAAAETETIHGQTTVLVDGVTVQAIKADALTSIDNALIAGGNLPADVKAIDGTASKATALAAALKTEFGMSLIKADVQEIKDETGPAGYLRNALQSDNTIKADVQTMETGALTSIDTTLAPRFTSLDNGLASIDSAIGDVAVEVHSIAADTETILGNTNRTEIVVNGISVNVLAVKDKTEHLPADPTSEAIATANKNAVLLALGSVDTAIDSIGDKQLSELTGDAGALPTRDEAAMLAYMKARNKFVQEDPTEENKYGTVYNDAGVAVIKEKVTDNGTTFTKDKMESA